MATTNSPTLPEVDQQPELAVLSNPEAVSSNSWHYSSGSMGPFFAVMSVLMILSVISCIIPRFCKGRKVPTSSVSSPLNKIMDRGCLGWIRGKWFRCIDDHNNNAQVLGEEVVNAHKGSNNEHKGQDVV
ncbi:hypothetical protein Leryth_015840 [Lithospermum erythrorhizon]|nr:hypothetical protein Leryth_015840 [Lithospermum erythrorhizon]